MNSTNDSTLPRDDTFASVAPPACGFVGPLAAEVDLPVLLSLGFSLAVVLLLSATGLATA